MKLSDLKLTQDALTPVTRGHPWVYRDGVRGQVPPPGTPVRLLDPRGKPAGWGLADEGPIAVRAMGREPPTELGRWLHERLRRADALRYRVVPPETDAYRVVNAAGDGLPGLVVDRYGGLAVLRLYSLAWQRHLEAVVAGIARLPWVETVYRRYGVERVDGRSGGETLSGPAAPESLVVTEAGLKFLTRPGVGQKTGLFLDQRENRRRVAALAPGRQVINLFAYNGGFSVHAAAAGAARVISVDIAGPALEDAKENFRLNGLHPERHGFERADVFRWSPRGSSDLVICDPPNLARDSSSDGPARKAYRDLAARSAGMVSRDGLLAAASCTARLSYERWEQAIWDGVRREGAWAWLERAGAPADHPVAAGHPEGRYLKFAVLTRL